MGDFDHLFQRSESPQGAARLSEDDLERFPGLVTFCTIDVFPDGSKRATGSIVIFAEAGSWKAALRDRQYDRTLFCTSESLPDLLEVAEAALRKPDADWRDQRNVPKPPYPPQRSRR